MQPSGYSLVAILAIGVIRTKAAGIMHSTVEVRRTETGRGTVKEQIAVDVNLLGVRIGRERIGIPKHQVSVLASINRTYSIIDTDDPRWVQGHHLNRLVFRRASVVHHLARLGI